MIKTPRTISITLGANEESTLDYRGRYLHVRSCSAASFQAAFDSDPLEIFYPGATYPSPEPFTSIKIKDNLGAGCDLVLVIADAPFADVAYDQSMLASISSYLSAIATDAAALEVLMEKYDGATPFVQNPVKQTGVDEDHVVTAADVNRKVQVQCPFSNGSGLVYVGFTTGVTAANAHSALNAGDTWNEKWSGDVYLCSSTGAEVARGYVLTI